MKLNFNSESTKGNYELQDSVDESDFVLLLFQRDYYCTNCKRQVQEVNERYQEFVDLGCEVVSILPENLTRAEDWDDEYDLDFPVVADEEAKISESFGQPVRFGPLGNLHDLIGRMPLTVLIDCRNDEMDISYEVAGSNPTDRPSTDDLIERISNLVD